MAKRFITILFCFSLSLGLVVIILTAAGSARASVTDSSREGVNNSQNNAPLSIETFDIDQFEKYVGYPSSVTGSGDWDSWWATSPAVISDSGQLRLWYLGFGPPGSGIGEASSPDGINWNKYPGNPLLTPGGEPTVLKEGPTDYKMWIGSPDGNIYRATSVDGLAWTEDPDPVFEPSGQEGTFDRDAVYDPSVILDGGGTYWMFYDGYNDDMGYYQIGAATSSDGINWTRVQSDPVLPPGGSGDWDESDTLDAWVILDGSTFKMWYSAFDVGGIRRIGYATSSDGINWTKYAGNPVFEADPGQWDDGNVGNQAVYYDGDYDMWYTSNGQIGNVTSTNGIDWNRFLSMPVLQPGDNIYIDVNYAHEWVEASTTPNASVAITLTDAGGIKAAVSGQAGEDGWFRTYEWPWDPEQPDIAPGDAVLAAAVGFTTTVDPIGTIEGILDVDADTIAGSIHAPWFSPITLTVRCEVWVENGPEGIEITGVEADGGSYMCDFSTVGWDLLPGQQVAVRYVDPDGDSVINMFETPWMRVNYAHDWVGGNYPAGHTFWITVTDSLGAIKATTQDESDTYGGWGGEGFETEWWQWTPQQPDIQPGDWAYFQSDDGYTNAIQVGDVQGTLDVMNDSVSGPIYASWFTQTLNVECHPWGAPEDAPGKNSTAEPDGSSPYTCQWDPNTEWDIQPGQDLAVMYLEPDDNDRIINVFRDPAPDMGIEKWTEGSGQVMPAGPVVFNIQYHNDGDGEAGTFTITDTLPANTTYFTDTSGITPEIGPDRVVWTLGPLQPGYQGHFQLVLYNDANPGETLTNSVEIFTMYDSNEENNYAEAQVSVEDDYPDLYIDKWPNPGDPVPGETFLYEINYGNNGPVSSGPVFFTDTLPTDTSIVSWYSEGGYELWSDLTSTGAQLQLTAPTIPGYWEDRIILRLEVDPGVPVGTQLTNTVEITTGADTVPGNNWVLNNDAWTGEPRWDDHINKWFNWGMLFPGGQIEYHISLRNQGNMPAQTWITDTLPEGTTFSVAWYWDGENSQPFPPDYIDDGVVAWDLGELQPGEWFDFDLRLDIDHTTLPGTEITNCAEIALDGPDSWPYDNTSCVVETVQGYGTNLRVQKFAWWGWEGQLTYEIQVQNIGNQQLETFWITDTYPLSTTFNGDWWVNHGPWITLTNIEPGHQLIFWVEGLDPGNTASIQFRVDLDEQIIGDHGLAFTNTLEAPIPDDVFPEDNYDQVVSYTGPDVYATKWLSGGEVRAGEIMTFTVEFGNANQWPWNGDDQYGSHLTDTLPVEMTFITATAPWDPDQSWDPLILPGNQLVWEWDPMWAESTWYYDIVVQITDTVMGGEMLTNRIEAYGDSPTDVEPDLENNVYDLVLTVLGAPQASFESNSPVRLGETMVFTNTSFLGYPPPTYEWDFDDGNTSTEENPSHLYSDPGLYTVTLTATNTVGSNTFIQIVEVMEPLTYLPLVFKNH